MAVNRDDVIKGALWGMGEPTTGPYKPGTWVYNNALSPYPFDPAGASALLAEAGWTPGPDGVLRKDGLPFHFTILVNQGNGERVKVATILQQQFRAIGVRASITHRGMGSLSQGICASGPFRRAHFGVEHSGRS